MYKRGLTFIELLLIITLIVAMALIIIPALVQGPGSSRRPSCVNNLKQWGLIFKMYSGESKGEKYPPLCVAALDAMDCDAGPPTVAIEDSGIVAIGPLVPRHLSRIPDGPHHHLMPFRSLGHV